MPKRPLIAPFGINFLVTKIKNGLRLRPVLEPLETGGSKIPPRPFKAKAR